MKTTANAFEECPECTPPADGSIGILPPKGTTEESADDDCDIAISLEINCSTLLAFEQDYKNRMSDSERILFENLTRTQQLSYLANAQFATWKAKELFPDWRELYNGKGDAFRHAYWNALNVIDLGISLAESLTTAHEDKPSSYLYDFKEKEMDLFNNQIGRSRWDFPKSGFISLEESILDAINKGDLKYLNNLHPLNNTATITSILIPTNQ
ncbi:MAG: hypothetical protein U1C58_04605 [Flavobacteriaceae bacterium]|nr:hypothetical protein [Flavobacteriaceae bacterium]